MERPYTYGALTSAHHIRILTLAPSEDEGTALECSIDQLHIDDPIKEYEAISYTWGGQERTERLECDGAIIKITPNLASALLCLRYRTRPRRLWADAVCINQENLTEKGQQIPLMARIFQVATQVRVWLGDGAEGESKALADLSSMNQIAGPTRLSLKHPLACQYHDQETYEALVDIAKSAKRILRMAWFTRRWIVQELVLNGNVAFHCGQSQISWQGLHTAFFALPLSVWDDPFDVPLRKNLAQLRDLWRTWCCANESPIDCSIYGLLRSFRDLECKEAKDKLYAIASLADDVELNKQPSPSLGSVAYVAPDYEASDEQVLQDLALRMIQSGKVFEILSLAGVSRIMDTERSLASWVPDFRQPGSWLLTATEEDGDFELVEACELINGVLHLKMNVYDGQRRNSGGDWHPVSVVDVFQPPKSRTRQHGHNFNADAIIQWLIEQLEITTGVRQSVEWLKIEVRSLAIHMLWFIARSQLLTEDDHDALGRLPSFEQWVGWCRSENLNGLHEDRLEWSRCLTRALSTWTIFSGECLRESLEETDPARFLYNFGFGPRDIAPRDEVLAHSPYSGRTPAVFLRPGGAQYKVIGGGLIWACGDWLFPSRSKPHQIEVRLI